MKSSIYKKNIVLGVCGGIAAYKSVELLRLLKKQGANVRVIMTQNALKFVGQLTFEALSEQPVSTSLFDHHDDASISHIKWANEADAVIIAPATANILGKIVSGIADDALTTFILAVTSKVILCPSMNTHMYENKAVQRNLEILKKDGYIIIEPQSGSLACGTTGAGRLPEPEIILEQIIYQFSAKDLSGEKILVTAGPTWEYIDPVRFITNPSSGKMGYAIAKAAMLRGGDVTLISGPTNLSDINGVNMIRVTTANEMAKAVFEKTEDINIIIKTAAVSDYRPKEKAFQKIKKENEELVLVLQKNTDILKEIGKKKKDQILVGFAAETQCLDEYARKKLTEKNLDIIVGNLVGDNKGFGKETNMVVFFYKDGSKESIPEMAKDDIANLLLDRIVKVAFRNA